MIQDGQWREIADARAKDMRPRIGFILAIGVAAWALAPGPWPLAWMLAFVAAQLATLLIIEPALSTAQPPSALRQRAFLFGLVISAAIFASIAIYCWSRAGGDGRLFATILLAGGALNVALQARACAVVLWCAAGPILLTLAGLPLVTAFVDKQASPSAMGLTALTALLFGLHLAVGGRRTSREAAILSRALDQADRERRRAEEASAVKSDFLAVISHEIRTPLNGVLGMAQAMATDRLSVVQKRRLRVLRDSGESLLRLLNDVLDLSEVSAGKLELARGCVEPQMLAREAEAAFAHIAAAKGVALGITVAGPGALARTGDPARVRQILHHLIDNALKFTDAGSVRVRLGGSAEALVIEVADTGAGMPQEHLAAIFERFIQGDASPTRRHGGSGVGLPLCQGLARLMGGELTASAQLGQGSVFTARLPLAPLSADAVRADAEAKPAQLDIAPAPHPRDPPERTIRILAAEDNATNRMVLQLLLEEVGLTAHMVENGQEAVDAWRAAHWDLILMDIQMPVMDGVAATRAIRQTERDEGRPRTPIVALTANAMSHQAAEYVAAGMDGLVPKPIEFGQLIAVIANAGEAGEAAETRAA